MTKWAASQGLLDDLQGYARTDAKYAQHLAAQSPDVVYEALGYAADDPRRQAPVTEADQLAAADSIVAQQRAVNAKGEELSTLEQPVQAIQDRMTAWQGAVDAAKAGGLTQAEADTLNQDRDAILADSAPLEQQSRDLLTQLRAQQGGLRDIDIALAEGSGLPGDDTIPDPAYAAGLVLPDATLDMVSGMQADLPSPTDQPDADYQNSLGTIEQIAGLRYRGAVASPRGLTSPLGNARLPSTLLPDIPGAMRVGVAVDRELGADTNGLTDPLYGRMLDPGTIVPGMPDAHRQVSYNPDALMGLVAGTGPDPYGEHYDTSGVRAAADAHVLGDVNWVMAARYAQHLDEDPRGTLGPAGSWFGQTYSQWYSNGDDYNRWTAGLDEAGQDRLDTIEDASNKDFLDWTAQRIAHGAAADDPRSPEAIEARLNPGLDDAFGQVVVMAPKTVEALWTEAGPGLSMAAEGAGNLVGIPTNGWTDALQTEEVQEAREQGAEAPTPFTDGIVHMVGGTAGRVGGLLSSPFTGDFSPVMNNYAGDQHDADGNVVIDPVSGQPVHANPWMTAVEDIGTASLVAGVGARGAGRLAGSDAGRALGLSQEAAALRTGLRDGLPDADVTFRGQTYSPARALARVDDLEAQAASFRASSKGWEGDMKRLNAVASVGAAPFTAWTRTARVVPSAEGAVLGRGADGLIRRSERSAQVGPDGTVQRTVPGSVSYWAGRGLGRAARPLTTIGTRGLHGLYQDATQAGRDRATLGLGRVSGRFATVEDIHSAASRRMAEGSAPVRGKHPETGARFDESAGDFADRVSARHERTNNTLGGGLRLGQRRLAARADVPTRVGPGSAGGARGDPTLPSAPGAPGAPSAGASGSSGGTGSGGPSTPGSGAPETSQVREIDGDGGVNPDGQSQLGPEIDPLQTGVPPPTKPLTPEQLSARGAEPLGDLATRLGMPEQTIRDAITSGATAGRNRVELVTDEAGTTYVARHAPEAADGAQTGAAPEADPAAVVREDQGIHARTEEVQTAAQEFADLSTGEEVLARLRENPTPERVLAAVVDLQNRLADEFNATNAQKPENERAKPQEHVTPAMVEAGVAALDGFSVQKETGGRKTQIATAYLASRLLMAHLAERPLPGGTDLVAHSPEKAGDFTTEVGAFFDELNAHLGTGFTVRRLDFGRDAAERALARAADVTIGYHVDFGFDNVLLDSMPETRGSGRSSVRVVDEADLVLHHDHPRMSDDEVAAVVARAGERGKITITTNRIDRGANVPLTKAAVDAGGLHVLITETLPAYMLEQARGRAGRDGEPGTWSQHTALDDRPFLSEGGQVYTLEAAAPLAEGTPAADLQRQLAQEFIAQGGVDAAFRPGEATTTSPVRGQVYRGPVAPLPANTAGIDLNQLYTAMAERTVPELTDAQNAALQQLLAEAGTTPQTREQARAIADLIPQRRMHHDPARQLTRMTEAVTGLQRAEQVGAELGMSPRDLADTLQVAEEMLRRAAAPQENGDPLALEGLGRDQLQAFVDHLRGRDGADPAAVARAVVVLRDAHNGLVDAGRGVRSEATVREQVLAEMRAATPEGAVDVTEVHAALQTAFDGLHPAEQALWNRRNQIEDLLVGLEMSPEARNALYQQLLDTGITTVAALLDHGAEGLGDAGATAIEAGRARLTAEPLEQLLLRRAHRDGLADVPQWTDRELAAVVGEMLTDVHGGSVTDRVEGFGLANMVRAIGLPGVADLLDRMAAAGALTPETTAMLDRANRGALTPQDWQVLVPQAAGAMLRNPQAATERPAQLAALAIINRQLVAAHGPRPIGADGAAAMINTLRDAGAPAPVVTDLVEAAGGPNPALSEAALGELLAQTARTPQYAAALVDTFATENGFVWDDAARDGLAEALRAATADGGDVNGAGGDTHGGVPGGVPAASPAASSATTTVAPFPRATADRATATADRTRRPP